MSMRRNSTETSSMCWASRFSRNSLVTAASSWVLCVLISSAALKRPTASRTLLRICGTIRVSR